MASVRRVGPNQILVRISIAEPLHMLAIPAGCGSILGLIALVGSISTLATSTVPVGEKIAGVCMLAAIVLVAGFVAIFGASQTWKFDKSTGRIQALRAGIVVRTESMAGLVNLHLNEIDDGDGGMAQAVLVYEDRPAVPINTINTGSISELRTLVDTVNVFLHEGFAA